MALKNCYNYWKNCYNYWQQAIILLITISIFCFWYFAFPYVIVIRESLLLFLWNSGYFIERVAIPGGLAQYIGEGLVQFFRNPLNGAVIYALLFLIEQWLTCQLLKDRAMADLPTPQAGFPCMEENHPFCTFADSAYHPLANRHDTGGASDSDHCHHHGNGTHVWVDLPT